MARATNVRVNTSTIYALDMKKDIKRDENNKPIANLIFTMNGKPSIAAAMRTAITKTEKNHKNVMVIAIIPNETITYNVSAATFIANSEVCKKDETYGHEFVTREFTYTNFTVSYIDVDSFEFVEKKLTYDGKTTINKLLNYARESTNTQNCAIDENTIEITTERRYMTKEKYMELGKEVEKK